MAGSEQLLEDLRETLLDCAPVGSYTALRALFVDARLSRWRHLLPYGESPADQADALIVLLHDRAGEGGAPGLALLLRAVAGRLEEADACHGRLLALAERVEASSGAAHADEVDGLFPALAEARRQTSDVYDLSGDFRGAVINIQSTIVQEAEVVELESLPPEPGEPPYRGLQYFTEADADRFFGRERLTARLVARLRPEPGQARFLAVVGASGSGKSSLVRAGLLPALRRGQRLADGTVPPTDSASWAIRTFTPTAHPLEALAAALLPEGDALAEVAALVRELEENPQSLGPLVRQVVARASGSHLLLVVDQFEELFTQCRRPELRQAFVDALLAAVDPAAGRPATVVVVLRADFYAHCAEYPGLRELVSRQQEYIGAMNRDELFEAIVRPAALGDWRIQEGLVELMLDEVEHEPGALPLLSHALLETWARRRGRVMTLSGYTEAGGVRGAIAQTAETIFRERLDEATLLTLAASAERGSEHPLGRAIVARAKDEGRLLHEPETFEAVRGKGIRTTVAGRSVLVGTRRLLDEAGVDAAPLAERMAQLEDEAKTAMLVAVDGHLAGIIAVADTMKDDSKAAVAALHELGLETAMITGDNERTARAIAEQVGIDHVLAEVLPDGKTQEVRRLQERHGRVAFVGDGINDAPALTQADVGLAIGTGTDIAIEASDVTLVRGELTGVVEAITLSRATFRTIKQNLFWAFAYNVLMIPLAVIGWMHPVLAEIAMATSSITVVGNANRLRRVDIRPVYRQESRDAVETTPERPAVNA